MDYVVITYASGEPYLSESKNIKKLCEQENIPYILYDKKWLLKTNFYKENKTLLDDKKSGFCAWKPHIILDALTKFDKVLYLDSSMLFDVDKIREYIEENDGINSTSTTLKNSAHIRRTCFKIMNCDSEKYWDGYNIWSGTVLVDKSKIDIIQEWKHYCLIRECICDDFDLLNFDDFKYPLYDQSILSLLFIKYRIDPFDENFWFFDTREPSHHEAIKYYFGNKIVHNQLKLNKKYVEKYSFNRSAGAYVYE